MNIINLMDVEVTFIMASVYIVQPHVYRQVIARCWIVTSRTLCRDDCDGIDATHLHIFCILGKEEKSCKLLELKGYAANTSN